MNRRPVATTPSSPCLHPFWQELQLHPLVFIPHPNTHTHSHTHPWTCQFFTQAQKPSFGSSVGSTTFLHFCPGVSAAVKSAAEPSQGQGTSNYIHSRDFVVRDAWCSRGYCCHMKAPLPLSLQGSNALSPYCLSWPGFLWVYYLVSC